MTEEKLVWNLPRDKPAYVGQYRSAFVPSAYNSKTRRWWNGRNWSNPYGLDWTENDKNQAKTQVSPIPPYWLSNEDLDVVI